VRTLAIVFAALLLAGLVPNAGAVGSSRTYAFTGTPNGGPLAGTFSLVAQGDGGGNAVTLAANQPVTWVSPTVQSTSALFHDGVFSFDFYLANPIGTIRVVWGDYETSCATCSDWHFRPLQASPAVNVNAVPRNVVPGVPVLSPVPSVNIGHATFSTPNVNGQITKGSFPAVRVISSNNNALYTHAAFLGASAESTATFPLPELPAIALISLGGIVVGGVAFARSRKGWN
jgi:hypothetical protein